MTMFAHNATTLEVKIRNSRPAWATSDPASYKSRQMRPSNAHIHVVSECLSDTRLFSSSLAGIMKNCFV